MEPYPEIFSEDVVFHINDGSLKQAYFDPKIYYKGVVVGEEYSDHPVPVALAIEDDKNRVTGYIKTKNERY
jgi:hypothetical protein